MNATPLPPPAEPLFSPDQPDEGNVRRFPRIMAPAPEIDLRDLIRKIWRRKIALFGTIVMVMVVTVIVVNQLTPRYTATSQVMIDPRQDRVIDIEAVISGLPQDMQTIESEIEVLKSRGLAERVIKKLRLYDDPEFNPPPKPIPEWHRYLSVRTYIPEDLLEILSSSEKERIISEEERLDMQRVEIIDTFLENLELKRIGRSRVIEITFESENPQTAARVGNTLADLYIVEQLEAKFEATKRATEWLNERVAKLRKAVTDSERAVEEFRKRSGLIQGKGVTLASQQISELNTQIILARPKRAEAEARLQQVERLLVSQSGVESVAEVLASPLIQRLREAEAKTMRKAAELSQEYGEKHPRMINIRAEIRDHRRKIQAEVNKIVQGLRNEVDVARVREESLRSSLRQLESRVARLNTSEVRLRALDREAEANRALYETFLARFKETGQQQDIQQPDARIISRADVPAEPSFPRERLIYAMALVGSTLLGIMLVLLIEQLDHGFRSMTQVEQSMGLPALGLIPMISGLNKLMHEPFDYVVERPNSAYGEAVRSLFTSILLSNVDSPPRTVLFTSSLPGEGKTSLAISLARMMALQGGKKIILIDADLRRPQLHHKLGLSATPGLVEYLAGEVSLEDILHRDERSNAMVITAGGSPNNPPDILASEQMRNLLRQLAEATDLVILDSPPVLAVSDARVLSRLADKTVYTVRWVETPRETAMMGLKQLLDVGSDVAGVVLTMVNVKRHSRYGYGDSGQYYSRYRKYYTS